MIGVVTALPSLVRGSPPCTAWVLGPTGRDFESSAATSCLQEFNLVSVTPDRVGDVAEIGGDFDRTIRIRRLDAGDLTEVIRRFLVGELKAVCSGDDDDALVRTNDFAFDELAQRRQRHAGVWAVEHAGAVGARGFVGELGFAGLFDDTFELFEDARRPA